MEAILVAGGAGSRLGEAAKGKPKPLAEVNGRPLASYMVERLARSGVKRVVVSCAPGTGEHFRRDLAGYGAEIVIAEEPEKLGRGGGVRFAASQLREDGPFFVVYGDELLDVEFDALLERHEESRASLTVTAAPLTTPFGVLELDDDGRVSAFREGPTLDEHWVNVGVYVMEPEIVELLPVQGDAEHTLFPELARQGRLWAHRHSGVWLTVNTPKDLERANRFLARNPDRFRLPRRRGLLARDAQRALDRARRARQEERAVPAAVTAAGKPTKPV